MENYGKGDAFIRWQTHPYGTVDRPSTGKNLMEPVKSDTKFQEWEILTTYGDKIQNRSYLWEWILHGRGPKGVFRVQEMFHTLMWVVVTQSTVVPSYMQFRFLKFHLPPIDHDLKMLNRKFQK